MYEFHFIRPEYFLAVLPFIVLVWLYLKRGRFDVPQGFIDRHLLVHLLVKGKKGRGFSPFWVLVMMWFIMIVALCGPTWKLQPTPFSKDQAGLMIVLKLDKTMLNTDVQPTRLDRAKQKIGDLLALRNGSRTGLIVYRGSAHTLMPLTDDPNIISLMLEELLPEHMPEEGDNLVVAIKLAEQSIIDSKSPGSILVIADQVEVGGISNKIDVPIQFLSINRLNGEANPSLLKVARAMGVSVIALTLDERDIHQVQRQTRRQYQTTTDQIQGQFWQDMGYALLWPVCFLSLFGFRKGWCLS